MINENIDPEHEQKKMGLRILGFALIIIGGILTLVAFVEFFNAWSSFNQKDDFNNPSQNDTSPQHFYLAVIGLPLVGAGATCLKYGYLGVAARYFSGEAAPVAKDTANYVAKSIEDGVEHIAKSISKDINSSSAKERILILCPKCKTKNDEDAKFCKECAEKLS
jgi:hypothetical protein